MGNVCVPPPRILDRVLAGVQGEFLAIELVLQLSVDRDVVKIGVLDRIVGMGPPDIVCKADADEGRACESYPGSIEVGMIGMADNKLRLDPLINVEIGNWLADAPWQMRITHEEGMTVRRFFGSNRPSIRASLRCLR